MVDRQRRRLAERLRAQAEEGEILLAVAHGALAGLEHGGIDARQLAEIGAGAQQEDAAVPEEGAAVDEALGGLAVRLLDEAIDAEHAVTAGQRLAALDVAVAGVGAGRLDAERDQPAFLRGGQAAHDGAMEVGGRGDDVVGRLDQHQRVGVARQQPQGGGGDRGTGVARLGLEQDGLRLDADLLQLVVDQEAVILVADEKRCREADVDQSARHGVLQHRALRRQFQELLGIGRTRQRPQARARATGQDDGMDLCRAFFVELLERADCVHELRSSKRA